MNKLPPQNNEIEQMVIGCLLIDKDVIFKIIDFLNPDDFYFEKNATLYRVYLEMFKAGEKIDLITLTEKLETKGFLESITRSYIANCYNLVAIASHILDYALIIKDKSIRRKLLISQQENEVEIYDETLDVNQVLATTQNRIFEVSNIKVRNDSVQFVLNDLEKLQAEYSQKYEQGLKLIGYSSGIPKLDNVIDGLRPGHFWVIGGFRGCLHKNTLIYDPVDKTTKTVRQRFLEGKEFFVYSLDEKKEVVITKAEPPKKFAKTKMFELKNGKNKIIITGNHKIWNGKEFITLNNFSTSSSCLLPTISDISQLNYSVNVQRLKKKVLNFLSDCHFLFHLCGQQFHFLINICLNVFPLPIYVHDNNDVYWRMDDLANKVKHNHLHQFFSRLSMRDYQSQIHNIPLSGFLHYLILNILQPIFSKLSLLRKFYEYLIFSFDKILSIFQSVVFSKAYNIYQGFLDLIFSYIKINDKYYNYTKWEVGVQQDDYYYDFTVPKYHNYYACGLFHHNTGKTAFALNIINNLLRYGVPVSIITLEMSQVDLIARLIGINKGLSAMKIIKGIHDDDEFKLIKSGKEFFDKKTLEIHQEYDLEKIKLLIRKDIYVKKVKVVMIDYIQKIMMANLNEETALMSRISIQLANLAQELKITILLLSQVSNQSEAVKTPGGGFKGSGTIEEVADLAIRLRRNKETEDKEADSVPIKICITKNKYGFDGVFDYYIHLPTGIFSEEPL